VGVGKRWNRNLMKAAAEHTGGYFTQINPDEAISWRTFELAGTLQHLGPAPLRKVELLAICPVRNAGEPTFLYLNQMLVDGEELCAIAHVSIHQTEPTSVVVKFGDGKSVELPVKNVKKNAEYLPRMWAKLEIDRLLVKDAAKHKDEIIALSKAQYVMTPFTSLLVLENEDMYKQYNVDKSRKDHWAMYPAPKKIEVVYEPDPSTPVKGKNDKSPEQILNTIAALGQPKVLAVSLGGQPVVGTEWYEPQKNDPSNNEFGMPVLSKVPYLTGLKANKGGLPFIVSQKQVQAKTLEVAIDGDVAEFERALKLPAGSITAEELTQALKKSSADKSDSAPAKLAPMDGFAVEVGLGTPVLFRTVNKSIGGKDGSTKGGSKFANGVSFGLSADHPDPMGGDALGMMPEKARQALADAMSEQSPGFPGQTATWKAISDVRKEKYEVTSSTSSNPFLYSRPNYTGSDAIFYNLLAYAPGLNTNAADVLAVLDAEAYFHKPLQPGKIDAGVQILFDKARAGGWQQLTMPGKKGKADSVITFDGQGRFAYTQTLPSGLTEQVVCNGYTLTHLYPQLGLAAKRPVSRFHRSGISTLLPWVVPPTMDFMKGADLRLVAARTVEIVPHGSERKFKDKLGNEIEPTSYRLRLVFAPEGALAERQIVEMPANKVLLRQACDANGVVRWLDGKGKELDTAQAKLAAAEQPKLQPSTKDLVVMDLPYRTPQQVKQSLKIEKKGHGELTFAQATTLLASYVASGNGNEARNVFTSALHNRNQRQLGYYVLLAAAGQDLGGQNLNVVEDHPDAPLAQFLALHTSPTLRAHASQWAIGSVQWKDPLLKHLATTHALYQRWQSKQMEKWNADRLQKERDQALKYVRDNQESAFGWVMLTLLQNKAGKDKAFHAELAKHWELFQKWPVVAYAARYEQARALWQAGQDEQARELFLKLYGDTFKDGYLPPLDSDFRAVLLDGKAASGWSQLLQSTAKKLIADKKRPAVLALAWQCWQLDDTPQANQLVDLALGGIEDKKERDGMQLAGVLFYRETKQLPQADQMLSKLLADPELAQKPQLWRLAGKIAGQRNMTARSMECLEKALDLEYKNLPEIVNLQKVRQDYGQLLGHYESLADALVALQTPPPQGFMAKVIKTADRWRALDPNTEKASNTAAAILRTLGEKDLGWDYLTTPIAMRPNEPEPWLNLAGNLKLGGDPALAELAYKAAFEAEPGNAQTLWDRAENLQQSGKTVQAQALYRQIAEGKWGPMYSGLVAQAKLRLK
jgi:tetratricopeptide (TPR) repeat protein